MATQRTLLGLPAEIRLQIYDFVFADAKVVLEHLSFDLREANNGVLATCRQLCKEARPLYRLELRIQIGNLLHVSCHRVPRVFRASIVELRVVDSDIAHRSSGKHTFPNLQRITMVLSRSIQNGMSRLFQYNDNFELIKICRSIRGGSVDKDITDKAVFAAQSDIFCHDAVARGINVICCFSNTCFSRGPGLNGALIGRMVSSFV